MKYVIEHLEPMISKWVMMEYTHIAQIVGKDNLMITNVKTPRGRAKLIHLGEVHRESITELPSGKALILDPKAEKELSPSDANSFEFLVFGGILGDYPPQGRTHVSISSRMPVEKRSLGPEQMSTDTAVLVAHRIMRGEHLAQIPFIDTAVIPICEGEEVELPFRYVQGEDGQPVFPEGLVEYLKKKRTF